jgi:hypothetical protein
MVTPFYLTEVSPMFRKLIVVVCLLSFLPAAVGAQGLTAIAAAPAATVSATGENSAPTSEQLNLILAAEKSATMLVAAADTSKNEATKAAPEQKRESHSSFDIRNFADVHLAEGRWIWWAGAIVLLAAIHIAAD